jgi:hypothetical protein
MNRYTPTSPSRTSVPATGPLWRRRATAFLVVAGAFSVAVGAIGWGGAPANAVGSVNLGAAASFGVLGSAAVTNTGPSVITGDVGTSPGTAISGFPPGVIAPGTGALHSADANALGAYNAATAAFTVADDPTGVTVLTSDNLSGQTLFPGTYHSTGTDLALNSAVPLVLDAQGNTNAVFVLQAGQALTTASGSVVSLVNGAQSCNVYWALGSSATLGTSTTFVGNILATASVTLTTGASIDGRAFALNGTVTLDTNTVTRSTCAPPPPPPVVIPVVVPVATPTPTVSPTATTTPTPSVSASASASGPSRRTAKFSPTPTIAATATPNAGPVPGHGGGVGPGNGNGNGNGNGTPNGGGGAGGATGPGLPFTGINVLYPAGIGLLAILLGAAAVIAGRRSTASDPR